VVAVSEPAFWRLRSILCCSFADYFRTPDGCRTEARREIRHRSLLLAVHQRERSENVELSREVIKLIRTFGHPRVRGSVKSELNKNTRNEIIVFEEQVDLAAKHDQLS